MGKRDPQQFEGKSKTRGNVGEKPSRDQKNGTATVSLRIPIGMLKEIDDALQKRPYRIPRHLWLLEAIHEKLAAARRERDTNGAIGDRGR
ncbi:MAG TPA: hypothetical protein VKX39_04515 [Bryobacteraceae bacterium]|jgi:hypothetical protein|nr:hypothetical protein [Bryobacteraceae bacterium]